MTKDKLRERVAESLFNHKYAHKGGVWWGVEDHARENVWHPMADAALAAIREAGFVVVPKTPNELMEIRGSEELCRNFDFDDRYDERHFSEAVIEIWKEMIQAHWESDND